MLQDLRFALRQLLKSRGSSLVAILTLALAIGANTAIFSAIDAVLLHPLPYPDPDRLVIVQETLPRYLLHGIAPAAADYAEFRRQTTCFTQIAAVTGAVATLTDAPLRPRSIYRREEHSDQSRKLSCRRRDPADFRLSRYRRPVDAAGLRSLRSGARHARPALYRRDRAAQTRRDHPTGAR